VTQKTENVNSWQRHFIAVYLEFHKSIF